MHRIRKKGYLIEAMPGAYMKETGGEAKDSVNRFPAGLRGWPMETTGADFS